jgi:diaminopimelate epimerase
LVLLDPTGTAALDPAAVVALCDRWRGLGADGVIRVGPGRDGADLSMELRNADGSEAEVSGNGLRCLAQAAVEAGLVTPPRFSVATGAGVRAVDFEPGRAPGHGQAEVDMGPVRLGPEVPASPGERGRYAEVGNPHLVLFGADPATVDLAAQGPVLSAQRPGGQNVEWIALGPERDELVLRVYERGAGETRACGTGSVAAAAVAHAWGLVGPVVRVVNPGGPLQVTLGEGEAATARLAGPVRKVADVSVDLEWLT